MLNGLNRIHVLVLCYQIDRDVYKRTRELYMSGQFLPIWHYNSNHQQMEIIKVVLHLKLYWKLYVKMVVAMHKANLRYKKSFLKKEQQS